MNEPLCQWLDDYLAHDLTGAERDEFLAHLDECAECRAAVREAGDLSFRLRSATEQFDAVSPDLALSIAGRIDAVRWRRRALSAIALAASIGFVAIWLSHDGSVPDTTPKTISPPIASAARPVRRDIPRPPDACCPRRIRIAQRNSASGLSESPNRTARESRKERIMTIRKLGLAVSLLLGVAGATLIVNPILAQTPNPGSDAKPSELVVFTLKHSSASEVARMLNELFNGPATPVGGANGSLRVIFVAVDHRAQLRDRFGAGQPARRDQSSHAQSLDVDHQPNAAVQSR